MELLRTSLKVLDSSFYLKTIFRDCHDYVKRCDQCQRVGNISRRDEMPLNSMLEVEVFDVWALISWARSLHQKEISTSLLRSIMFPSGWKPLQH